MRSLILAAVVMASFGCSTAIEGEFAACTDDVVTDWDIHPSWLKRQIDKAEAVEIAATGNIPGAAESSRLRVLLAEREVGDTLWFYRRPAENWVRPTIGEEGVVFFRGCEQLGFVTTKLATGGNGG